MALHLNNLNIQVPFPPSIIIDEIVQLQLRNGIKNVNGTMNAFFIYRKEFNHIVTNYKNYNLELKDISSYASISWKQEPKHVKEYYKQLAKKVKERFKEKVPSLCFIDCNHVGTGTNINRIPILNMDLDYDSLILNMDYNCIDERLAMDENEFMDHLSDDLALTYRAIVQSIPF
ncbi:3551_t:CDS:1 [Diversispora eburnea]|uniref:3551_t:CDS:1 n=1 Tax=Diversispora eburnea TaxID=1213867 RepID=A0A9N8YXC9_9GLOM|nr:3551_t:CDS:1 [Diversispora eburnea]